MAKYELLSQVDFGMHYDAETGFYHEKDEGPSGVHEAGAEVELSDEEAQPLLEAGVVKKAGDDNPFSEHPGPSGTPVLDHDKPEEYGYAGEKQRDEAMKESKSSSKSKSSKPKE